MHLDEVETLAPGTTVLATNAHSDVQAAEIRQDGATAWAVQYHPEFSLADMAAIMRRYGRRLIKEGFFADEATRDATIADLEALDREPDNKPLAWRYALDETVLDGACAPPRSPTGSRIRCCRRGPAEGASMNFADRHVVVTGGTGALGIAVVGALLEAGATCHVPYRSEERGAALPASRHKSVSLAALGDLADEARGDALSTRGLAKLWASIHIAGGFAFAPIENSDKALLMGQIESNLVLGLSLLPRGASARCARGRRRAHRQCRGAPGARAAPRREHDRLYGRKGRASRR